MLKHRLTKIGNALMVALCMLFVGGLAQSCDDPLGLDDYKYDDKEPDWLGGSIYEFLNDEEGDHTYKYFVRLIDSLEYSDVLNRTGSKTIFIVDDKSFDEFFASNNRWNVHSFEDLTKSQMKTILNSSMLDNAYLLNMMSSTSGDVEETRGKCLRRNTSAEVTDSVPFFPADSLPDNNHYWAHFREKGGMRLAIDNNAPMMVHFLPDYLKNRGILDSDMNKIFESKGLTRSGDEVFIYMNKVLSSGIDYGDYADDTLTITCKNGYLYRMNGVLIPPSNMAEELRNHHRTQLFSRMLDRFSLPVYNQDLSNDYNGIYNYGGTPDSVFVRRYVNSSAVSGAAIYKVDVNKNYEPVTVENPNKNEVLKFDPGSNRLQTKSTVNAEEDMAAMFVPADEYMYAYFSSTTSGKFILEQFSPEIKPREITIDDVKEGTKPNEEDMKQMMAALDSIPLDVLSKFVNNLMRESFYETVPSKFGMMMDDGYREMGLTPEHVDECVVANNGVIYILNNVFGPAIYQSVAAPPTILYNMEIMNELMVYMLYNSYLLAMDATYSFIVPDDDYFVYYDPASMWDNDKVDSTEYAYKLRFDSDYTTALNAEPALYYERYRFDRETFEIYDTVPVRSKTSGTGENVVSDVYEALKGTDDNSWIRSRARELLENLIIVGSIGENKYYQTKGYAYLKCDVNTSDEAGHAVDVTFYGGEQIDLGSRPIKTKRSFIYESDDKLEDGNGITYCTYSDDDKYPTGIPTPTTTYIYDRLKNTSEFEGFFELADDPATNDLPAGMASFGFFMKELFESNDLAKMNVKYSIFKDKYSYYSALSGHKYVPFLSKYHYTVYVPTNEALEKAYECGLPTWLDIANAYEAVAAKGGMGKAKVRKMAEMLNKFLRYHFQDNSVYVDENVPANSYETSAINDDTGRFLTTQVSKEGSTLAIEDQYSGYYAGTDSEVDKAYVITEGEENVTWNVMARDLVFPTNVSSMSIKEERIESSSFAVLHLIDRPLLSSNYIGYDGRFKRFSDEGYPVEQFEVAVANEDWEEGDGNIVKYLVAYKKTVEIGGEYRRIGYLMRELEDSTDPFTREEYVQKGNGAAFLITEDGFLLNENNMFVDKDGKEVTDKNGNLLEGCGYCQVNKDGTDFVTVYPQN